MRRYTTGILVLLGIMLSAYLVLPHTAWIKQDQCLDQGGQWQASTQQCHKDP